MGHKSPQPFGLIDHNLYWQENLVKTDLGQIQSKSDIQKVLAVMFPDFDEKMKNEDRVIEGRIRNTDKLEGSLCIATGSTGTYIYRGQSTPKQCICLGLGLIFTVFCSVRVTRCTPYTAQYTT